MQVFAGYDPANNPLNTNEWAFPVCEVLHIVGFAMLIGTIIIYAFGATWRQRLIGVQLPLALPNVMAGINQTTMMATSVRGV